MATILLIDDDLSTLKLVGLTLKKEDHRVVTASAGEEGLNKAFAEPPDLIICDLMMPGLDGYEVCRRLRRDHRTGHLPILVLTARAQLVDREASFEAGADDYLAKPFRPKELVNKVEVLLRESRIRPTVALGRVISLFSLRGGVGVTSLAVNLAVALAQQRKQEVPLLDLCLASGHVDLMLNLTPKLTWVELAGEEHIDREVLDRYLLRHPSGVRVLPAPSSPTEARTVSAETVKRTLAVLRDRFDYIVVDTSSAFDEITRSVLTNAYLILLILTPEVASLRTTLATWQALKSLGYPDEKLMLVLNRIFPKGGLPDKTVESILKWPLWAVIPHDSGSLIRSIAQGEPLILSQPASVMAKAVENLSSQISEGVKRVPEKEAPSSVEISGERNEER